MNQERLEVRVHGAASWPTLVYLPGLHGDWTLIRRADHNVLSTAPGQAAEQIVRWMSPKGGNP
jgi:hypothetical protein